MYRLALANIDKKRSDDTVLRDLKKTLNFPCTQFDFDLQTHLNRFVENSREWMHEVGHCLSLKHMPMKLIALTVYY